MRGGIGTGTRTVGMLGAILTYARQAGIIETNPAHGIRKPAYQKRTRRLFEDEYRLLGKLLRKAAQDDQLTTAAVIARTIALRGCRRGEIINLIWPEVDIDSSCIRLTDSKEGASVRPIGLPAIDLLTARRPEHPAGPVFVGTLEGKASRRASQALAQDRHGYAARPRHTTCASAQLRQHRQRPRFHGVDVAALLGRAPGTVTSRSNHTVETP